MSRRRPTPSSTMSRVLRDLTPGEASVMSAVLGASVFAELRRRQELVPGLDAHLDGGTDRRGP